MVLVVHGSQCDGCDIMAIPKDWTQKVEVLESVGTAIDNWNACIETLESQQESQNPKQEKN